MAIKHWLYQLFIAVDQLANVLATPFSSSAWADETLSSRCHRMDQEKRTGWTVLRPVVDWLFFRQEEHCKQAFEKERKRIHSPPEQR